MTDSITSESIVEALRRARIASADPAGESPLDQLVRSARFNDATLQDIKGSLPTVIGSLQPPSEWWALHVLLGQLRVKEPRLGETIDSRIATGGIVEPGAQLWAARCVLILGATLSATALERLSIEGKVADPVLWFGIMLDTQERAAVEDALVQVAALQGLDSRQLSDVVRTFKRWAIRNGLSWNAALSRFFECLATEIAVELANALHAVIGPSFGESAKARLAVTSVAERPPGSSLVGNIRNDFFPVAYSPVRCPQLALAH